MIELINDDCMKVMARYPDKYFDLAIVDPPYGIGADLKNSKRELKSIKSASVSKDYGDQNWDSNIPDIEYFLELKRVSKNQIIWGVNYYPYSELFVGGRLFWDKGVTMPTYSKGELAYLSWLNSIDLVKIDWHGMIQHDMKNKESRIHPTQKPVQLYKWLFSKYAKNAEKILDTHLGSGSSAIAAHDYKVAEFIGTEIDKDYYDAAVKRFNMHKSQQSLF